MLIFKNYKERTSDNRTHVIRTFVKAPSRRRRRISRRKRRISAAVEIYLSLLSLGIDQRPTASIVFLHLLREAEAEAAAEAEAEAAAAEADRSLGRPRASSPSF